MDRDGTINVDSHFPHDPADFALIEGAVEGLKILSKLPVHVIVASNQAGIALGYFNESAMVRFNEVLRKRVHDVGGRIDAFYYCPHREAIDLPADATPCECSKPAPGMLIEAANDFGLSLAGSFMIGDKNSDVAAGQRVGCTTILVRTGKAGRDRITTPVHPHYFCNDLKEAAFLIEQYVPVTSNPRSAR